RGACTPLIDEHNRACGAGGGPIFTAIKLGEGYSALSRPTLQHEHRIASHTLRQRQQPDHAKRNAPAVRLRPIFSDADCCTLGFPLHAIQAAWLPRHGRGNSLCDKAETKKSHCNDRDQCSHTTPGSSQGKVCRLRWHTRKSFPFLRREICDFTE